MTATTCNNHQPHWTHVHNWAVVASASKGSVNWAGYRKASDDSQTSVSCHKRMLWFIHMHICKHTYYIFIYTKIHYLSTHDVKTNITALTANTRNHNYLPHAAKTNQPITRLVCKKLSIWVCLKVAYPQVTGGLPINSGYNWMVGRYHHFRGLAKRDPEQRPVSFVSQTFSCPTWQCWFNMASASPRK